MKCRSCSSQLNLTWANLRTSPPSNSFLTKEELNSPETYYPLKVEICTNCWLAQVDEYKHHADIFSKNYVYFSSFSSSWLNHAKSYVGKMIQEFEPRKNSMWIEIASNDGYLLQYVKEAGINCLGIEPTESTAKVSREKGIDTITEFFGVELAKNLVAKGIKADIMSANNVLAHVPNLHDFVGGFRELLSENGVVTFEFPHLMQLLQQNQFDTIYHEHFSYLSVTALVPLFKAEGLRIFNIEEIPTHGGSLRVYATPQASKWTKNPDVETILRKEREAGLKDTATYKRYQAQIEEVKVNLIEWLVEEKKAGRKVVAYGAAAKGNTLLNYCGIDEGLISVVADASPYKQNMYLPGSRIPVVKPESLKSYQPDTVLILPWNLKKEVSEYLTSLMPKGTKAAVAVPSLEVWEL